MYVLRFKAALLNVFMLAIDQMTAHVKRFHAVSTPAAYQRYATYAAHVSTQSIFLHLRSFIFSLCA